MIKSADFICSFIRFFYIFIFFVVHRSHYTLFGTLSFDLPADMWVSTRYGGICFSRHAASYVAVPSFSNLFKRAHQFQNINFVHSHDTVVLLHTDTHF